MSTIILFQAPEKYLCSPVFRECPASHIDAYEKLIKQEYAVEKTWRFKSSKEMDLFLKESLHISEGIFSKLLDMLPNYKTK